MLYQFCKSTRAFLLSASFIFTWCAVAPALIFAQGGIITTVAGNTQHGFSGDGGPATQAMLAEPYGTFVDPAGNIFIADTVNQRIRKVTAATGIITTVAGNGVKGSAIDNVQATQSPLNDPTTVAVDGSGNLFIADQLNDRIRKVSAATGIITTVAGTTVVGFSGDGGPATSAELCHPYGITVDAAGNLYIADAGNHRIRKVTASDGKIRTVAGSGTASGTTCNGQAGTFAGDGGQATAAKLYAPTVVTLDASGNLIIGDHLNHCIRKVTVSTGVITTIAGIGGSPGYNGDGIPATQAQLHEPYMAGLDRAGNLYIPDYFNYRIRKVTVATGVISTVAGNGFSGFDGDGGPATQAYISDPTGVALDTSDNFYIVDQFSNRIRKVTATGPGNPPVITVNPTNNRVIAPATANFTASATGSPSVQWQVSTDNATSFSDVPGATGATYSFATSVADDGKYFRARFTNSGGSAISSAASLIVRAANAPRPTDDVDGDMGADPMIWRPGTGTWWWLTSSSGYSGGSSKQWGNKSAGDMPFLADMDADGIADLVIWRASTGTWFWLTSSSGYNYASQGQMQWGNKSLGDIPMLGDLDGDGRADLIVWRPSNGTFFWLTSSSHYSYGAQQQKQWGNQSLGDKPFLADFDGDQRMDLAIWRASNGTWYWLTSSTGYSYNAGRAVQWGSQGNADVPLLADLDGDGKSELIVWRPSNGTWYWLTSSSGYNSAAGQSRQFGSGSLGDTPLLTDFDGDGRADLTVWRGSTGAWYWLTSASGFNRSNGGIPWGSQGQNDVPMVK